VKCPKCGNPNANYVESRKKYWGGKKGFTEPNKEPRKNFEAKCPKCKYTWDNVPEEIKSMEVEKSEVQEERSKTTEDRGTNISDKLDA